MVNNGNCSSAPGWYACSLHPESCNESQMVTMNNYIADFSTIINATNTYNKPGNGAFIHSCHTHCEAQSDDMFTKFAVDGVTMQHAVSKWWNSNGNDPSSMHTYRPCSYKTNPLTPHTCNPTCTQDSSSFDVVSWDFVSPDTRIILET